MCEQPHGYKHRQTQKPVVRVGRGQLGGRRETYRAMSTGEEEDGARSSPEMREHNSGMRIERDESAHSITGDSMKG